MPFSFFRHRLFCHVSSCFCLFSFSYSLSVLCNVAVPPSIVLHSLPRSLSTARESRERRMCSQETTSKEEGSARRNVCIYKRCASGTLSSFV